MDSIRMVEVTRSNEVESVHYGTAVLINSSGKVLKDNERKLFEIHRIKTDVMIAEMIAKKN